jgi:hypothetical protein
LHPPHTKLSASDILKMKYGPRVLSDAERLFSEYKNILANNMRDLFSKLNTPHIG